MVSPPREMRNYHARLATFYERHTVGRERASSNSRKKTGAGTTVQWPHKRPEPEALARAGFFSKPTADSPDNLQCFDCAVKLDGWEENDDAVQEHLSHTDYCNWATVISVTRDENDNGEPEMRDPLSTEMVSARTSTFQHGDGWPHEKKKGWKCKVAKLVDAGWVWDPHAEGEEGDGTTCCYCNMTLDGWEPKDDPFQEHKRRTPDCRFFQLLELYHGTDAANGKMKKTKGRAKAGVRSSTASKASRMSTQSAMSAMDSVAGDLDDVLADGSLAGPDDSILTTATNASQATNKGSRKASKTKATTKGKKKAQPEQEVEHEIYSDVNEQALAEEEVSAPPARASKRARTSKQPDSSVVEISHIDAAAPKKRGRKPKAQPQPEPEPESEVRPQTPDAEDAASQRISDVSAQLYEELDQTAPLDQSTPIIEQAKPKRGVKRTSEGLRKDAPPESSMLDADAPKQAPAKRARSKKTTKQSTEIEQEPRSSNVVSTTQPDPIELDQSEASTTQSAPVAKKGKGRPKGKGKASSTRSSRSSKATTTEPEPAATNEAEDLERDEREIEEELQRIANEQASQQAMQAEQEQVDEYEPSPSQGRVSKDSAELKELQDEVQAEGEDISRKDFVSPWKESGAGPTPSPSGSEKENRPSSTSARSAQAAAGGKTVRIPVAASTPNRSPGKRALSPSKQISHLQSSVPWEAVDLDAALLPSPQPTPGKLEEQLAAAAGTLTEEGKKMSVEDFVRHRAGLAEEQLRKGCERLVAAFEREGMRGLESLNGIDVAG